MQDLQKIVSALPRLHLLHSREHAAPLQLNLKHQSASGPLSAATLTQCSALSSTAEDAAVLSLMIAKSENARLGLVSLSSSALHEGTPSISDLLPALATSLARYAMSLTPCWCTEVTLGLTKQLWQMPIVTKTPLLLLSEADWAYVTIIHSAHVLHG